MVNQAKNAGQILDYFQCLVGKNSQIDPKMYEAHDIKRGLRNKNGTGVLVGITKVADVHGYDIIDDVKVPVDGSLTYRGYDLEELIRGARAEGRSSFEEVSYLLLFSELPSEDELQMYNELINGYRQLPERYLEEVILRTTSHNLMNKLQQCVLSLYDYDDDPDNTTIDELVLKAMELIAKFPLLLAYSYAAKKHYIDGESLIIHQPRSDYNTAENILSMIRPDQQFTELEAEILDMMLVVHADHGGGNNSAFATHVVSSTGTDIYSCISTALGSLKGPRHGGANIKAAEMLRDISEHVENWESEDEMRAYLQKILDREAFDHSGLIYGLGHAVYTKSDPRARVIKATAKELARNKGMEEGFAMIEQVERVGGKMLQEKRNLEYPLPANVDLYSGYVYKMLGIPETLYTPMFALSRTSGWCAHLLEQIMDEKIMRPAYLSLRDKRDYEPIEGRVSRVGLTEFLGL